MSKPPVNLNLLTIQFPITAISSISHRISGVIIFFFNFPILSFLLLSVSSEEGFNLAAKLASFVLVKIALTVYLAAFIYHFLSGIRHLVMDFGYWETLKGSKNSAYGVFILFFTISSISSFLIW